jgi:dTDP-4-amino-4,6-dideoxygalactose transaminase
MKEDLAGGKLPYAGFGKNAAWWAMMILALRRRWGIVGRRGAAPRALTHGLHRTILAVFARGGARARGAGRRDSGRHDVDAHACCGDGSTAVPLLDLKAQYGAIRAEVLAAVERVLADQIFILGPEVAAFESEIARFLSVEHAIGVSSGSDALVAALRALDVGPGDAVLCPAFTFFATAGAASRLGALPLFLDVDDSTLDLSAGAVARYLKDRGREAEAAGGARILIDAPSGRRVRAVVPVHLFGAPADVGAISALCRPLGVAVVEDAAQAIGARRAGRPVGTLGDVACFSFFPSKNLGACGDAGLVATDDAALAARIRRLRVHGSEKKYTHLEVGYNFRLDALQAAMLRVKLPRLAAWNDGRRDAAARYRRLFGAVGLAGAPVRLPAEPAGAECVYHQFVIRVAPAHRDPLAAHLEGRGIGTAVYYPTPLHRQPCYELLGYRPGDLPVSERACGEVLALPMYPELTEEQQRRVVAAVQEYFATARTLQRT